MPADLNTKIFHHNPVIKDQKKAENCAFHISNKYRYIIQVNETTKGQLLIVEVTPLSVSERLPPSLKQKKFGT